MSAATEKSYIYKHFSAANATTQTPSAFMGVLKVVNEFHLQTDINTAGAAIELVIPYDFQEQAATANYTNIIDDDGDTLVDDEGNEIVSDFNYSVSGIPNINDKIEVWEFSDDYPDGKLMFTGIVMKFSGSYKSTTMKLTVASYGIQLDNKLVQILPNTAIVSHTTANSTQSLVWGSIFGFAETFSIGAETTIDSVTIELGVTGTGYMQVYIYEGTPPSLGATMLFGSAFIPTQAAADTTFRFSSPLALAAGTYTVEVRQVFSAPVGTATVAVDTGAGFGGGSGYTVSYVGAVLTYTSSASDLKFSINTPTGAIGNAYNSYDPSDIMRSLLDSFNGQGGIPTYTDDSIVDTGSTVSYTFKYATFLDAIKKVVELAPADWYWYVDPADSTFYFDVKSSAADHTMVRGKHLDDVDIEYDMEEVKNNVIFSGGDDGSGTNLVARGSNTTSIAAYGDWLELVTDNRVTDPDTAEIIINSILNEKSTPKFHSVIKVPATVYDITSFRVGQSIGFRNFNSLIDSLVLQIKSKDYVPGEVVLTLEVLPPTQAKRIEDIKRNLYLEETRDNPNNE